MPAPFDFSRPPFDCLTDTERVELEATMDLEYFAVGETVIGQDQEVDALYVTMKGCVIEAGVDDPAVYRAGAPFDTRALVAGRGTSRLLAHEDSIVFRIPRDTVLALTRRNPLFGAYFYQDVAKRLAFLAHRPLQRELQSLWMARVRQAPVGEPHWLEHGATVLDAARTMRQYHVTSVLVRGEAGSGIFTQSDLRNTVIDGIDARSAPVAEHARYVLHGVEEDDFLYQAMLTMTHHGIQRVVVTREGEVVGVLEQVDLLAFLSNHSHLVAAQIERAGTLDELRQAARDMERMVSLLHGQGVKVTLIAELVSELHHKLLARLFAMVAPPDALAHVCLLLLGSEGRGEQIMKTDQDNALLVEDGYRHPELPAAAARFNELLVEFGYPPCPGGVMLSNPRWRQEIAPFKRQLEQWMDHPDGENAMNLAIWQDATPIAGRSDLYEQVRTHFTRWFAQDAGLLARFALPVEQHFDAPRPLLAQLWGGDARDTLDLKKSGIFVIVHGARSLALEAGIIGANTYRRLDALARGGHLDKQQARDLAEALAFLQALHLKHALAQAQDGKPIDYRIAPGELTTLEGDLLKDTLAVVKRFRAHLRHHFQLDTL
ncbi:cyclic nucleotide-binding protein [Chitiniphilus shinanonensis]|uniref:Cyclic nucleotide-binding protein n=1 Tax=Chitiniphilus shinanonensis TaxID=553088 RepID=A0ABQ6C0T2_9NEIS|nr:DUF294 nucleotidyltransferase-like domain-containing protein [Chitiniphilus shinanonensis]GLS05793.1 cyclic nucleotide-binding protein [Chitiniphilus shinanonensis]